MKCISVEHRALPGSQWGASLRGVCAKHDLIVCRHGRSLPDPGIGCQCQCHTNMTFTSSVWKRAGYGTPFSFLIQGSSNWASFDVLTQKSQSRSNAWYRIWNYHCHIFYEVMNPVILFPGYRINHTGWVQNLESKLDFTEGSVTSCVTPSKLLYESLIYKIRIITLSSYGLLAGLNSIFKSVSTFPSVCPMLSVQ